MTDKAEKLKIQQEKKRFDQYKKFVLENPNFKNEITEIMSVLKPVSDELNKNPMLVTEFDNNNWIDITCTDWVDILEKFYDLGKNLKAFKGKKEDKDGRKKLPYSLQVLRTIFLAQEDDATKERYYEFEKESEDSDAPIRVYMDFDKCTSILDVKDTWCTVFGFMGDLWEFYKKVEQNPDFDAHKTADPETYEKDPPHKFLAKKMASFHAQYDKYNKGKKFGKENKPIVMDKLAGEPALGGFTYCYWMLHKNFIVDLEVFIKFSKYWSEINKKLRVHDHDERVKTQMQLKEYQKSITEGLPLNKKHETVAVSPVPKFKLHTNFQSYVDSFIKVFEILWKNPVVPTNSPMSNEHKFKLKPNKEVMSLFCNTEYVKTYYTEYTYIDENRTWQTGMKNQPFRIKSYTDYFTQESEPEGTAKIEDRYHTCRYEFGTYFSTNNSNDNQYLYQHYAEQMDHPIIRHLLVPLHAAKVQLDAELENIKANETWRVKLDLNRNQGFYDAMFRHDRCYYDCYELISWNYKRDQLICVYETVEWLYKSKWLDHFFTDGENHQVFKNEIIPLLLTYSTVLKYRQYLDFKNSKLQLNKVYPKYAPDYVMPSAEEEEIDDEVSNFMYHEWKSGEHYLIDYKTKEVTTYRQFLMQDVVPDEQRPAFEKLLLQAAERIKDIREDVRNYIKSEFIMQIWAEYDLDSLQDRQRGEQKERADDRLTYDSLMDKKVKKPREEKSDKDNYIPYLQDYEEQGYLKEVDKFKDKLQVTMLRTPYTINNINFKNEDKFTMLSNSDNCYEDERVSQLKEMVYDLHEFKTWNSNHKIHKAIEHVFDYFIKLKDNEIKKKESKKK